MSESKPSTPLLQIIGLAFLVLALTVGFLYFLSGKTPVSNVPIPRITRRFASHFKRLSTGNYNHLVAFVRNLAEDHTDRLVEDFNAFHGIWNEGFVARRYRPNHPIPSPEVERSMSARLESFLKGRGIDGSGVMKLELRYGPWGLTDSDHRPPRETVGITVAASSQNKVKDNIPTPWPGKATDEAKT